MRSRKGRNLESIIKEETGYRPMNQIGNGAFGTVYEAYSTDMQKVAIKVINTEDFEVWASADAEKEIIEFLKPYKHKNILEFINQKEVNEPEVSLQLIITAFYPKGDLFDYIRNGRSKFNEERHKIEVLKFMQGITAGVEHLHSLYVVHGDIKLENVLLGIDNTPVLCDFGAARKLEAADAFDEESLKTIGTKVYIPLEEHEFIAYKARSYPISTDNDVYALGILLYVMWGERLPEYEELELDKFSNLVSKINTAHIPFNGTPYEFPDALEKLILACVKRAFTFSQKERRWKRIEDVENRRISIKDLQGQLMVGLFETPKDTAAKKDTAYQARQSHVSASL